LHHAAHTNKLSLVKYLVDIQNCSTTIINKDDLLAIDLTSSSEVEKFLKNTGQVKSAKEGKKSEKKSGKGFLGSIFKKKETKTGEFDFLAEIESAKKQEVEVAGRRSIAIKETA